MYISWFDERSGRLKCSRIDISKDELDYFVHCLAFEILYCNNVRSAKLQSCADYEVIQELAHRSSDYFVNSGFDVFASLITTRD